MSRIICGPIMTDIFSSYRPKKPTLSDLAVELRRHGTNAMELPQNSSSNGPDVHALLSAFRLKRASDPRDKIYALVGLSSARNDSRFVVNYSASVRQVDTNVARYILVSSKKLDIICPMVPGPPGSNEFDLPSWVPDWTTGSSPFVRPVLSIIKNEGVQYGSVGTTSAEYDLMDNDQI